MGVLLKPAITHFGKAEHPLDDPDRMFDPPDVLNRKDWVKTGYGKGVPMGGDLSRPKARRRPSSFGRSKTLKGSTWTRQTVTTAP